MSNNFIDDLVESDDISFQQILNNLLDGKLNLDLKTHIFKPKQLASLKTLMEYLKLFNYDKSSKLIRLFLENYLRYMVSYKRLGRTEIIKALTNLTDDNEGMSSTRKITKNLK